MTWWNVCVLYAVHHPSMITMSISATSTVSERMWSTVRSSSDSILECGGSGWCWTHWSIDLCAGISTVISFREKWPPSINGSNPISLFTSCMTWSDRKMSPICPTLLMLCISQLMQIHYDDIANHFRNTRRNIVPGKRSDIDVEATKWYIDKERGYCLTKAIILYSTSLLEKNLHAKWLVNQ